MIRRCLLVLLVAGVGCAGADDLGGLESQDLGEAVSEVTTSDRVCTYYTGHCSPTTCFYECTYTRCDDSGWCIAISEVGCYPCANPDRPPRDPPPYET